MTKFYIKHIHLPSEKNQLIGMLSSEEIYPLPYARTVRQAKIDAREWVDYRDLSPEDYVLLLDERLKPIEVIRDQQIG